MDYEQLQCNQVLTTQSLANPRRKEGGSLTKGEYIANAADSNPRIHKNGAKKTKKATASKKKTVIATTWKRNSSLGINKPVQLKLILTEENSEHKVKLVLNDIQNSNTSRNLPVKSTSLSHMNVYIFASFLAVKTPVRTSTTTFPHTSSQDAVIYCDLDNFHSSSLPELFTLIVAHKMVTEQPLFKPEIFE